MGAEPADAARARPLLDQLCRRIEHCGPVGAGATMKLTINLPLMVYWQALGEALALCRPLGLDPARVIDLLSDTSGGPNVLKVRGPALVKLLKGEDPAPVTFTLDNSVKDLRTMLAEGAAHGVDMPLVAEHAVVLRGGEPPRPRRRRGRGPVGLLVDARRQEMIWRLQDGLSGAKPITGV